MIMSTLHRDIADEQMKLRAFDLRISEFKICPNLIKLAFGQIKQEDKEDPIDTPYTFSNSKRVTIKATTLFVRGDAPAAVRPRIQSHGEESVGSSDKLADVQRTGSGNVVSAKLNIQMKNTFAKTLANLSVRKKKKLMDLIEVKIQGMKLQ